jgi:hypothetical protein
MGQLYWLVSTLVQTKQNTPNPPTVSYWHTLPYLTHWPFPHSRDLRGYGAARADWYIRLNLIDRVHVLYRDCRDTACLCCLSCQLWPITHSPVTPLARVGIIIMTLRYSSRFLPLKSPLWPLSLLLILFRYPTHSPIFDVRLARVRCTNYSLPHSCTNVLHSRFEPTFLHSEIFSEKFSQWFSARARSKVCLTPSVLRWTGA